MKTSSAGKATRVATGVLVVLAVLAAGGAVWFRTRGVSVPTAVALGAQAITGPLFAAIGAVILQRRPRHAMGWLFVALGVVSSLDELTRGFVARQDLPSDEPWMPALLLASDALGGLIWIAYSAFLPLLFPDGKVPSKRWRPVLWALVSISVIVSVGILFVEGPLQVWVDGREVVGVAANPFGVSPFGIHLEDVVDLFAGAALLFVFAGLAALVIKWRRDPISRQQIKWFLFGFVVVVAGIVLTTIPALQVAGDVVASLAFAVLPVTMGIAITRYRLFEIDRILSRTVSYLLVAAVLIGLYVGAVLGLGAAARALTGESNDVVVALSTLLVAAVFQPLRGRMQNLVDRRFNRARFDYGRVVESFAARTRDEVDSGELSDHLRDAVGRSLQPRSIGLLLVPASPRAGG